ncbi:translesion DNA synthesis-associated protein ImuA [Duganella sp. CY15W]|uniref:translesion DNA synthesis-associated protein ImuA n=1 Tax=Duganella sp. CY15W TaxID=2692172 RepID=UPI0013721ED2|nr:translesion DNA synthesis-associated protein ImuA [Duganella sp. CY15W]MYM30664.1 translesion DNA synthesis-associated protein ImuA [Duganella sp. CY15W]
MLCSPFSQSCDAQRIAEAAIRQHVWRADELSRSRTLSASTGYECLDAELPDKGWPQSSLVELLVQQPGIGEMHLLRPALAALSKTRYVALIEPPHRPNAAACKFLGLTCSNILWIRAPTTANALWAAEQILRNGSCGAVLLWQKNIRTEALRRLNLAAQSTDTTFWLLRPLSAAADASPAPLRIALRPSAGGISAEVIKRRGPHHDQPLIIPLAKMPARQRFLDEQNAVLVQRSSPSTTTRVRQAALV